MIIIKISLILTNFLSYMHFVNNQLSYLGCFFDNNLKRDLDGLFYENSVNLTIEDCCNFCSQNFYAFCGLQQRLF